MIPQELKPKMIHGKDQQSGLSLSLRWKVILVVVAVIFAAGTAFSVHHTRAERKQIDKKVNLINDTAAGESKRKNRKAEENLQNIAIMLTQQPEYIELVNTGSVVSVFGYFFSFWNSVATELDLEYLAFQHGASGKGFHLGSKDEHLHTAVGDHIAQAEINDKPTFFVFCSDICYQGIIVTISNHTGNNDILTIGTSLTKSFIQSGMGNDTKRMLLQSFKGQSPDIKSNTYIPAWNSSLMGSDDADNALRFLQEVSKQYPSLGSLSESVVIDLHDKKYLLSTIAVENSIGDNGILILNIADVTAMHQALSQDIRNVYIFSAFGMIIATVILMVMLWRPLRQIKSIAEVLPRLVSGEYVLSETRSRELHQKPYVKDEISLLSESTLVLADKLRDFQLTIDKKEILLKRSIEELVGERDFVSALVDSAKIVVVVQNGDRQITLANEFACRITGLDETNILHRKFEDIFKPQGKYRCDSRELSSALSNLTTGNLSQFQHETEIEDYVGWKKTISWTHSGLNYKDAPSMILSIGVDITDRKEAEEKLAWIAEHDSLTGLHNRRKFQAALNSVIANASRYGKRFSVILMDLDHFKEINDTGGHQAGDHILQRISAVLRSLVRTTDVLARLGGDEFALLLPEATTSDAMQVVYKIDKKLNFMSAEIDGKDYRIGASIGLAMYPDHGESVNELLANADIALYQAKSNGRGGWHMFEPGERAREHVASQREWKRRIQSAIETNSILLMYQPIMNLNSNEISHYEVLVRLLDPELGVVYPDQFMKLAEDTGLISTIDNMVMEKAIARLAELNNDDATLSLAINVSAITLMDRDLVPNLRKLISEHSIEPGNLVLEITETVAVSDYEGAVEKLNLIRAMGCSISLDDFGVGFSSFYYMKKFPLDYVKIDGSFIRNINSQRDDQVFVTALCELARCFNMKVIAEFVENEDVLRTIRELGVDYAQGYYIGKPNQFVTGRHSQSRETDEWESAAIEVDEIVLGKIKAL